MNMDTYEKIIVRAQFKYIDWNSANSARDLIIQFTEGLANQFSNDPESVDEPVARISERKYQEVVNSEVVNRKEYILDAEVTIDVTNRDAFFTVRQSIMDEMNSFIGFEPGTLRIFLELGDIVPTT
jgi:hypothetical protein